jgi:hypothetical protein
LELTTACANPPTLYATAAVLPIGVQAGVNAAMAACGTASAMTRHRSNPTIIGTCLILMLLSFGLLFSVSFLNRYCCYAEHTGSIDYFAFSPSGDFGLRRIFYAPLLFHNPYLLNFFSNQS